MKLYGLQKTSLLDYPAHLSAILFTGGCNFNCPFCQNAGLLHPDSSELLKEEEIFSFLRKRLPVLDGVVITGGEPTIQADLPEFVEKIKELGLAVKLDTNGARPEVLRGLLDRHLLDYLAMDVKASPRHYERTAGVPVSMDAIRQSIRLIQESGIPYEFRTTVVKQLHDLADFQALGELLSGADTCFLQTFRDSRTVNQPGLSAFSTEEMEAAAAILRGYVKEVSIR